MVGLPASGKTTWAEKHCSTHPNKRYTILGVNLIMDKMKVSMLARKQNYNERWEVLIKMATEVLNKLFLLAAKNKRNYIIDQVCLCYTLFKNTLPTLWNFQNKNIFVSHSLSEFKWFEIDWNDM